MYCRNCGTKLIDDSLFCDHCGCAVSPAGRTSSNFRVASGVENVVSETVRQTCHARRSAAKALSIIALLIAASAIYLRFFVSSPESTLNRTVKAVNEMDLAGAIECFSPKVQREYKAMMGVGDAILGMAGLPSGLESFVGLAPLMGDEYDVPQWRLDVVDVTYSGENYDAFPIKIPGIEKLLASDAYVTVDEYKDGEFYLNETIHFKRYGNDGWLIEDDVFRQFT
ncbi:MAG: hypothetical protein E7300_07315 [Lachnospiraceae bacterium]|nr:hypothetical protein [Lachnospiraceae bacterium]